MSYLGQSEIANNAVMLQRVMQCAVQEGVPDAETWAQANRRRWAAAPGWDAAWASARVSHEDDDTGYDPGVDEGVITDSMILSQVQAMT